jgi:hypothetical protein
VELKSDAPLTFQERLVPKATRLAGRAALVRGLGISAPVGSPSAVADGHVKGNRRHENGWTIYDKRYWPGSSAIDHLAFALRHEPIDLLILKRALAAIPDDDIAAFVRKTPTSGLARRVWFLHEHLTGRTLDIGDAATLTAVDALDPEACFTGTPRLSKRHRVRDNLLGTAGYCPVIRRTPALDAFIARGLADRAAGIVGRTGVHLIARAASFLLLADSRASFEIEGERPPRSRLERWGRAVLQAGTNPLSLGELNRLHGVLIADNRFIRAGLRVDGVFLGDRDPDGDPLPEFIGARPDDLAGLLTSMLAADDRMREGGIDPVLHAAAIAFGFVYVHPYEDGNGRLHRYLVHHVLAERKFTPPGLIFPVSSVMLDRIDAYRATLQAHSAPLMPFIEWRTTRDRNVDVTNDTADLYRYVDCTDAAEFLYACVTRTVEHDLPQEIDFLRRQDDAERRIMATVEMPDRLARNLIMFMRQNGGTIPGRRRKDEFSALTDDEVARIEAIYADTFGDDGPAATG